MSLINFPENDAYFFKNISTLVSFTSGTSSGSADMNPSFIENSHFYYDNTSKRVISKKSGKYRVQIDGCLNFVANVGVPPVGGGAGYDNSFVFAINNSSPIFGISKIGGVSSVTKTGFVSYQYPLINATSGNSSQFLTDSSPTGSSYVFHGGVYIMSTIDLNQGDFFSLNYSGNIYSGSFFLFCDINLRLMATSQ